jgi:hypothetical protein
VTATKLGHPMRLACTSDAMSASVDPGLGVVASLLERGPAGASSGRFVRRLNAWLVMTL